MEIGLLLPCNIIIYETDEGEAMISIVDPLSMSDVVENEARSSLADEVIAIGRWRSWEQNESL